MQLPGKVAESVLCCHSSYIATALELMLAEDLKISSLILIGATVDSHWRVHAMFVGKED